MSTPASYPLSIRIGDTETINLTVTDADGPIDITGRTYAAQIRVAIDDATPIATFVCAIADAAGGRVTCSLTATVTGALVPNSAVWDLHETNGAVVTTLLAGPVQIQRGVTR